MRMLSDVRRSRVGSHDRPIRIRQAFLPCPLRISFFPLRISLSHTSKPGHTLLHSSLPLDPQTPLPTSLPNPFIPLTHPPRPFTSPLIPLTLPSSSIPRAILAKEDADDLLLVLGGPTEDEDDVLLRGFFSLT